MCSLLSHHFLLGFLVVIHITEITLLVFVQEKSIRSSYEVEILITLYSYQQGGAVRLPHHDWMGICLDSPSGLGISRTQYGSQKQSFETSHSFLVF